MEHMGRRRSSVLVLLVLPRKTGGGLCKAGRGGMGYRLPSTMDVAKDREHHKDCASLAVRDNCRI